MHNLRIRTLEDEAFYPTATVRARLGKLAKRANKQRGRIAFGSHEHRPAYILRGASAILPEVIDISIVVDIAEVKRNWATVCALIRSIGLHFLVRLRGRPIAIL